MRNGSPTLVTMSLASAYENIELAQFVCDYLLRSRNLPEEVAHAISMALRESMANAIKHGNRGDPNKRVTLTLEITPSDVLRLAVEDEGAGFDPSSIGDPLAPENRLKSSGRGIFYMRNFMDEVRYDFLESGTRVVLEKRLSAARAN